MKVGIFGFNIGPTAEPDAMAAVLHAADQAAYESVWTGEHVVLIDPQEPPSPAAPETPMLDTVAALAFAAAHTERVSLKKRSSSSLTIFGSDAAIETWGSQSWPASTSCLKAGSSSASAWATCGGSSR